MDKPDNCSLRAEGRMRSSGKETERHQLQDALWEDIGGNRRWLWYPLLKEGVKNHCSRDTIWKD